MKFLTASQVSWTKNVSVRRPQKKFKKLWTRLSQKQQTKATKFETRLLIDVSVKFPLKFEKFQIRPSRFYAFMKITYNSNVSLNVTEWLASPRGTTFSKPIEEMSKEELNVV